MTKQQLMVLSNCELKTRSRCRGHNNHLRGGGGSNRYSPLYQTSALINQLLCPD